MITIKSEREIELMRHAGMLVSKMHQFIKPYIKEGISTYELDQLCEKFILENDAVPTCKDLKAILQLYVLVLMMLLYMVFLTRMRLFMTEISLQLML